MNGTLNFFGRGLIGSLVVAGMVFQSGIVEARQGQEISMIEDFALASDREAVLQKLVPGSEEYFYLNSLHAQNLMQLDKVDGLLVQWKKQYGETGQWRSIRNRQALLSYEFNPEASVGIIKTELNLSFDHQRRIPPASRNLPSQLEASLFEPGRLIARDLQRDGNLARMTEYALYRLGERSDSLAIWQKRELLKRIQYPDYPGLVGLVVAELRDKDSGGFGSLPIHLRLTAAQLDECRESYPDLGNSSQFARQYAGHLLSDQPELPGYLATRMSDLDRVIGFLRGLPPSQNSFKAAAIHERLKLGVSQGVFDLGLFLEYLQLPRNQGYMHPRLLNNLQRNDQVVNLSEDFQSVLRCPPPHNDTELVDACLQHFLTDANAVGKFSELINKEYLEQQLAIAQVMAGLGEASRWSAILTPGRYRELVERVDLEFNSIDRLWYTPDEAVSVSLKIKNIDELVVRIYELDTLNCYRENPATISADLSLEGLVPNHERRVARKQQPAIRTVETVQLGELDRRGVYIVDFIGGGKNCRALIHKGRLTGVAQTTASGHEFRVLDENSKPLMNGAVWLDGRKFEADDKGIVFVPFSNAPGEQKMILEHDGFASLSSANIVGEDWTMEVAMHVDRESLIAGQKARVLLRPSLRVAGVPVPAKDILNGCRLTMTANSLDDDQSVREFRDLVVDESGELAVEFMVPPRMRTLRFDFAGSVRVHSRSSNQDLSGNSTFAVNRIDTTGEIIYAHLLKNRDDYLVELLGRNGEPATHWPVSVELQSAWSNDPVVAGLQSDETGRILLGKLADIRALKVVVRDGNEQTWDLTELSRQTLPSAMTVLAGKAFRLPVPAEWELDQPESLSLFRVRGSEFEEQVSGRVKVQDGSLFVEGLEAGDYLLRLGSFQQPIRIWCVAGEIAGDQVVNRTVSAPLLATAMPAVNQVNDAGETVRIHIAGASGTTRVHVLATRYVPRFSAGADLGSIRDTAPVRRVHSWDSNRFVSSRNLGDEYLYILNRKTMPRLPGNMLERPTLLLAPWSLGPTENLSEQLARDDQLGGGEAFGSAGNAEGGKRELDSNGQADDFSNLDFLESGTVLMENLRPDAEGNLVINREKLGDRQHLTIVTADLFSTSQRTHSLAVAALKTKDQRLSTSLAVDQHLSLEKRSELVAGGKVFRVEDILTGRFEAIDDLGDVWRLMTAVCDDQLLDEFGFIARWSQLPNDEQEKLYAKHSCHELNYYLFRKDRELFDRVVTPLIANRHSPSFMDQFLLGHDLQSWTRPWRFSQLNSFERILLAQKHPEVRPGVLRSIDEQWQLLGPDVLVRDSLFEAVIMGGLLEEDSTRQGLATRSLELGLARNADPSNRPASPTPQLAASGEIDLPATPSGGGGGGGRARRESRSKSPAPEIVGDFAFAQPSKADASVLLSELEYEDLNGARDSKWIDVGLDGEAALGTMFRKNGFADRAGFQFGEDGRPERSSFYQAIKPTERLVESNYWRIPQTVSTAGRISMNRFWRDYAAHNGEQGFLSPEFAQCHRNLSDAILAMAVLDLPELAKEPRVEFAEREMNWTPDQQSIVYHQQLNPLPVDQGPTRVMASENFFDAADRYQYIDNRQADKFVSGKFYTHRLYGSMAVVTNPTSTPQSVNLLVQIPQGAIAVSGSRETRTVQMELPAFGSASHEYWFYFPEAGTMEHYPAHVSDGEQILAWANAMQLEVTDEQASVDTDAWDFVSQNASDDQLLAWMEKANLQRINLADIAFRMREKRVFQQVTSLLANRFVYNPVLWSYSLTHQDAERIGEYLENEESFVGTCGPALDSKLVGIHPETRRWHEHVEFSPLINARAHQTGARRKILNDSMHQQYETLLSILACRRELTSDDRMAVVYYLLLQDRVSEAVEWFALVDAGSVAGRMQYDYAAAWLAVNQSDTAKAQEIASKYVSYPVESWQKRFAAISAVVREASGAGAKIVDADSALEQQTALAESMPALSASVAKGDLVIDYRNLKEVSVQYHEMDVELVFSQDPFSSGGAGGHSLVRPNQTETLTLPGDETRLVHQLPESLRRKNVIAQLRGGDQTVSQIVYANDLDVQTVLAMGQLQVRSRSDAKVLPAAYIKVYAQKDDGSVTFFKDGYTDIRGRFDYVTQSNVPLDNVTRFSVLVWSDEFGCEIRTVNVPQQ